MHFSSVVSGKRFVVKIGSSVLTAESGRLLPQRLRRFVAEVAASAKAGRAPVIVTSGAIACGMAKLGVAKRPVALAQLQACAAVGQGELMHVYTKAFSALGLTTAQVLLTQEDLADERRYRNARQTLLTLLHRRVIPIINENDTVAVDEITFGDNDRLAALVASAVDAHLLILLSDVDGLLRDGRVLRRVESLRDIPASIIGRKARGTTRGGMASKLEAARIAGQSGIPMVIANGTRPAVLAGALDGRSVGTFFAPPRRRLSAKQRWLAFSREVRHAG